MDDDFTTITITVLCSTAVLSLHSKNTTQNKTSTVPGGAPGVPRVRRGPFSEGSRKFEEVGESSRKFEKEETVWES